MEKVADNTNKKCTKCGIDKPSTCYSKDKSKKDGLRPSCVECDLVVKKAYYEKNRVLLNKKNVERQRKNIDQSRARKLRYSQTEKAKQKQKEYRAKNRKKVILTEEQKIRYRVHKKKYRDNNREKLNEKNRLRTPKLVTKEKRKEYKSREYAKIMADPLKKLNYLMRNRLRDTVIKGRKFRTKDYILFTSAELKAHLEKLWLPGMSWSNYSRTGWHIDHIRPCASFDMSNPEDIKQCWKLSNLQPLWAKDNLKKGDSWSPEL